jgi:hypothetical protein
MSSLYADGKPEEFADQSVSTALRAFAIQDVLSLGIGFMAWPES